LLRTWATLAITVILGTLVVGIPHAGAIPLGQQISNGDFGNDATPSLTSWTTSGTANARPSTDALNASGGNAGFNTFFASSFAALGDTAGDISGTPFAGTHSISQTFILPAISGTYNLTISFRTVFDGEGQNNQLDTFRASLNAISLLSQSSLTLPTCGPLASCASTQLAQNAFSQTLVDLLPGTYTLKFELVEQNGNASNTAAGIDSVSVIANSSVPEPSSLLLLMGAAFVGVSLLARRARGKMSR